MTPVERPLELSADEMQRLVAAAMERLVPHLESLPNQPAHDLEDAADVARALVEPLPETGTAPDALLDLLFERAVPKSFNTAGPGYLAYIPGGGLFPSAVAALIADAVNRYVGVWLAAPALVQIEMNVIRWFCDLVGYGPDSGGILTSGGSLANFSAVVAARRDKLPENFLSGRFYVSDQAHHSLDKAAMLAGFPSDAVRVIPVDGQYRMRLDALQEAIAADRRDGRTPFLVVGGAGTTNTGAVDDLAGLAAIAAREGLWFHADAAYGGFFLMTSRGRGTLRGIERADSITLDPHKGLFLPYGSGSLLVKRRRTLRRAHERDAAYLPEMREGDEFVDFCQISPELSRGFRGLRVWLPMKLAGAEAFRRNLDEKLDLTTWAHEQLREIPGLVIVAEPQLSIVAFRLATAGSGRERTNVANRELLDRINARRRVYLTGTTLDGYFVLRICVLSFRTHLDRMEAGMADIRAAVAETLARVSLGQNGVA
ncbi:MAG TPA: pyridoxal-dependent decarboxylase [Gemmatimonadales bacterium]